MVAMTRLPVLASALLLLTASLAPLAAEPSEKADAALRKLLARRDDPPAQMERLRQDILTFRREYPGTPQATRAAVLLSQLPSPLDLLEQAKIPALERFDWQPKELVAVAAEHRGRQAYPVSSVAYTTDGRSVASGGGSYVRLWDPDTMRLRQLLGAYSVMGVAFTPNTETLGAACADGLVRLWEMKDEKAGAMAIIKVSTSPTYCLAFTPDSKRLATGSLDTQVRIWKGPWNDPPEKPVFEIGGHNKAVSCVAFSPDGKILASGSYDGDVRLWDVSGEVPKELHIIKDHGKDGKAVYSVAFDPTAKEHPLLATAGEDGKIRLWRLSAGRPKEVGMLASKLGAIYAVTFSADGHTLAYGEGDYAVHLYDLASKKERSVLKGHEGYIASLAFGPRDDKGNKSKRLVSGSVDWTARLWEDVSTNNAVQKTVTVGHISASYAAPFAPDLRGLTTSAEDKSFRVWDIVGGTPREKAILHVGVAMYDLAYLPDSKRVVATGATAIPQTWDLDARKDVQSFKGHESAVYYLALSPDGRQLLTGSLDKTMRLWDVATGKELRKFDGHAAYVNGVAFSPDGKRVASTSGNYEYDAMGRIVYRDGKPQFVDCNLRVWDMPNGKERKFDPYPTIPYRPAFSQDNETIATGSYDYLLRFWPVGGGVGAVVDNRNQVYSLAFSPDGKHLATTGSDQRVTIRDAGTGKMKHEWVIQERVSQVAWAADSRHLSVTLGTGVVYILRIAADKD
jgi:WD40 repeat protein